MTAVDPVAWMCTRETTKGGRVFDEPVIATNRAYVEAHPLHDWSPLYSQATVDTLRAQLEAAEAGNHRRSDSEPTWAELTQHWKARAEAAEAECAVLKQANIAYSQQVNELIGRLRAQ